MLLLLTAEVLIYWHFASGGNSAWEQSDNVRNTRRWAEPPRTADHGRDLCSRTGDRGRGGQQPARSAFEHGRSHAPADSGRKRAAKTHAPRPRIRVSAHAAANPRGPVGVSTSAENFFRRFTRKG